MSLTRPTREPLHTQSLVRYGGGSYSVRPPKKTMGNFSHVSAGFNTYKHGGHRGGVRPRKLLLEASLSRTVLDSWRGFAS